MYLTCSIMGPLRLAQGNGFSNDGSQQKAEAGDSHTIDLRPLPKSLLRCSDFRQQSSHKSRLDLSSF